MVPLTFKNVECEHKIFFASVTDVYTVLCIMTV